MSFTLLAPLPLAETTSVLPNPLYGDSEGTTGTINILRSVSGKRRTYVKSRDRRKLSWTFRLTRNKALELFEFYRSYNAQEIVVIDHNDRRWRGHMLNNPFEIEMARRGEPARQGLPEGATCVATIEFEGSLTQLDPTGASIFTPQALSEIGPTLSQNLFADFQIPGFGSALQHNWDANSISQQDGSLLTTWLDSGPAGNDLISITGDAIDPNINRAPVYRSASPIFNDRPTVAFETVSNQITSTIASMRTTSNTSLFPSRRGTIFWVFAHTINPLWETYLNVRTEENLEAALDDQSFNSDAEFGVWSLENTNGSPNVEQFHISGSTNQYFPATVRFEPADENDEIRLATTEISPIPSLSPNIYMLSRNSDTTLTFRTNGVDREGVNISNNNPGYTGKFYVNNQRYTPEFNSVVTAEWGQVLIYNKALSSTEIDQVEAYLSFRWGIPLGDVDF